MNVCVYVCVSVYVLMCVYVSVCDNMITNDREYTSLRLGGCQEVHLERFVEALQDPDSG